MFSLEANSRYFMCQHPVNMRKGIDSLFNLIQAESPLSPMSGDVFVFFSKNRQSVKLLRWDTDGFLLYQKRLERGSFEMPRINPATGYPARNSLLSASIAGPDCITTDALATACMVVGVEAAAAMCDTLPGIDYYFIYSDSMGEFKTVISKGFEAMILK